MSSNESDRERMGIMLLHGAGLGGWIWEPVTPHLTSASLTLDMPALRGATDPDLRGLSLDDVARSVAEEIDGWGRERVVLVGHSLGGLVALAAAAHVPGRIAHLVFLGAAVPRDGDRGMPLLPSGQRAFLSVALRWVPTLSSPGHARGPWPAMQRAGLRSALCGDLDERAAARVVREFTPAAPRLYTDPVRWGGLPASTPRSYITLANDRSGMSIARQEQMIANLGDAHVHALDTGHLPMLSRPRELAAILNAVAPHCP